MRDIELYRQILGLTPPWTVVSVNLDVAAQEVAIYFHCGGLDLYPHESR